MSVSPLSAGIALEAQQQKKQTSCYGILCCGGNQYFRYISQSPQFGPEVNEGLPTTSPPAIGWEADAWCVFSQSPLQGYLTGASYYMITRCPNWAAALSQKNEMEREGRREIFPSLEAEWVILWQYGLGDAGLTNQNSCFISWGGPRIKWKETRNVLSNSSYFGGEWKPHCL